MKIKIFKTLSLLTIQKSLQYMLLIMLLKLTQQTLVIALNQTNTILLKLKFTHKIYPVKKKILV